MKCINCGFENPDSDERCFRCKAFLGQVGADDLVVPRKKDAGIFTTLAHRAGTALTAPLHRHRVPEKIDRFGHSPFYPATAAMLSLLCPGLGQVLNRRYGKALIFFGSMILLFCYCYYDCFRGMYTGGQTFNIFLHFLGNYAYYITLFHTWIVFDAYVDAIRISDGRNIALGESAAVSLLTSILLYCIFFSLQNGPGQVVTLLNVARSPNLQQYQIAQGDTLVIERGYYQRHEVRTGDIVENYSPQLYMLGNHRVAGPNPGAVLALPGETLEITSDGIFNGKARVSGMPQGWESLKNPVTVRIPEKRYFVLPGFAPGGYLGEKAYLMDSTQIGGKAVLIANPVTHRRQLP